jgi:DNA polymerase III delta prime subunit
MDIFPSILIVSGDKDLIKQKIEEFTNQLGHQLTANNPDIFILDESSGWGIDEVRKIKGFLSQKPYSHSTKIILIFDSHNLNDQAQNALLKILEEPGENNHLILTTNKASGLLPTIVSRCHTVKISGLKTKSSVSLLKPSGNLNKDLLTSENLAKNKEDVLPLLEEQLKLYQSELIKNPSPEISKTIEKLMKSIRMINSNVDPKSALDYFFLG